MTGIERLADIVNDGPYSGGMIHISVQKLREICEQIEREVDDISGRDSDVLAWVEKNGGLEAVKERTMPEEMSWPFYEDGEPVRLGEHWQQDGYDWSITSIDSIEFAEDGVRFENEYADAFYRYGERVKRPAPKVLDADGVEIRVGDTVYEIDGTGHAYKVVGIRVGDGDPLTPTVVTCDEGDGTSEHFLPGQLTHERPDSWERLEDDATMPAATYCERMGIEVEEGHSFVETMARDLVRRCKAFAERDR